MDSSSKYSRVVVLKTKAKPVVDPFAYDRIQRRRFWYLIEIKDGICKLCPSPSPASYATVYVPEYCIKLYKPSKEELAAELEAQAPKRRSRKTKPEEIQSSKDVRAQAPESEPEVVAAETEAAEVKQTADPKVDTKRRRKTTTDDGKKTAADPVVRKPEASIAEKRRRKAAPSQPESEMKPPARKRTSTVGKRKK